MKFRTSLKRVLAGLTVSLTAITMIVPSVSVSAAPTKNSKAVNDYLFVPAFTGSAAMDLLSNANSSDTATLITKDTDENSVTITFPAGTKAAESDTVTRTATKINIDMNSVAEHVHKYISFDMSVSDMMDFVASMDVEGKTGNARPLSLYLTKDGVMGGMQHSQAGFFADSTNSNYNTFVSAMSDWFKKNGYTLAYENNKMYNIKMVQDIKDGKTWVYIDGVMKGQETYTAPNGNTRNKDFKTNKMTLTHYATKQSAQSVTLKNLEIGDCYNSGLVKPSDSFTMGNGQSTTYYTPTYAFENNRNYGNVFIRLTMPTDRSWHLAAGECKAMWNATEKYGVCCNWSYTTFKSQTQQSTENIGNISCYKYTPQADDKIKVTFEFDRNNKVAKVYTDKGAYHEYAYNDTNFTSSFPKTVVLTCEKNGDDPEIAASDIGEEYGEVVPIGLNVKDSKEAVVETFKTGEKYYITTCNQYEGSEILLYAWYDENNTLVSADSRAVVVKDLNSNGNACCLRNTFTATAPDNAVKLRVYLWNSVSGLKPLCESKTLQKYIESAE